MSTVTVSIAVEQSEESVVARRVVYADTPALRRKGVLGKRTLGPEEGVLLVLPARPVVAFFHGIHMFGVPFALAVAWLDERGNLLNARCARPGRMYFPAGFLTRARYIPEVHRSHLPLLQQGTHVRWRKAAHDPA